jgi:hypothetical protein
MRDQRVIAIHLESHFVYKTIGKVDYKKLIQEQDIVYRAVVYYDSRYKQSLRPFLTFLKEVGYTTKPLNAFNMAQDLLETKADELIVGAFNIDNFLPLIPVPYLILNEAYTTAQSLVMPSDVLCDDSGD